MEHIAAGNRDAKMQKLRSVEESQRFAYLCCHIAWPAGELVCLARSSPLLHRVSIERPRISFARYYFSRQRFLFAQIARLPLRLCLTNFPTGVSAVTGVGWFEPFASGCRWEDCWTGVAKTKRCLESRALDVVLGGVWGPRTSEFMLVVPVLSYTKVSEIKNLVVAISATSFLL